MLSGKKRLARREVWLIGSDVSQSPSPVLHNAGFSSLGVPLLYFSKDVSPRELTTVVTRARHVCRGLNLTMPYKVTALDRLKISMDHWATACGAANTILFDNEGKTQGFNTDVPGLLEAWDVEQIPIDALRNTLVIGTGGAAMAVLVALREVGCKGVSLYGRNRRRLLTACSFARELGFSAINVDKATAIVVAAPAIDEQGRELCLRATDARFVHTLAYRGFDDAEAISAELDCPLLDGWSMLLFQAVHAHRHFISHDLPLTDPLIDDKIRAALELSLKRVTRTSPPTVVA